MKSRRNSKKAATKQMYEATKGCDLFHGDCDVNQLKNYLRKMTKLKNPNMYFQKS